MALTDINVRTVKPADKPFKLIDGEGMHLLVNPNGSKYWRLQYRFSGKQKMLALGFIQWFRWQRLVRGAIQQRNWYLMVIDPSQKKKEDRLKKADH